MRLTDPWFEAAFLGEAKSSGSFRRLPSIDGAQGIFLYSPCGYGTESGAHGCVVWFANPRGSQPPPPQCEPSPRWQMSGTGLHDLTLSPSINMACGPAEPAMNLKAGECKPGRPCWHGFITNGEVR